MLGNRTLKQIIKAAMGPQHYIALINMFRCYPDVADGLIRYLTGGGNYPCDIRIRTPIGMVSPTLFSSHDMLTINEIFCRKDYAAGANIKTVVDFGSNIGISALYFLTRNMTSKCYLYEPDSRNVQKLKINLAQYESRYSLEEIAVSSESAELEFGIEPTGRYGGLERKSGERIKVKCINVNEVIGKILDHEESIDILKIDTEGVEIKTVAAMEESIAKRVRTIYLEANPTTILLPKIFDQKQYGSVCRLQNRYISRHAR